MTSVVKLSLEIKGPLEPNHSCLCNMSSQLDEPLQSLNRLSDFAVLFGFNFLS